MPCPAPVPISGSDSVSVNFQRSHARAQSRAQAAVPAAALASAIHDLVVNNRCPADCPFPAPTGVRYTITGVTSSAQVLANVFFGWLFAIVGDGWFYEGTANYNWTATARCTERRPESLVVGYGE